MREEIDCLTSVAKLRELFREWMNTPGDEWETNSFFNWLATRDNEPRFVALAYAAAELVQSGTGWHEAVEA